MTPPTIFLSYSRKDQTWADRLKSHLQILGLSLEIWDDLKISAGEKWMEETLAAIDRAGTAILLISPAFLTSAFIQREEVPRLLERQQELGLRIVPILIEHCPWQEVPWLRNIQFLPRNAKPLSSFSRKGADSELVKIARAIEQLSTDDPALEPVLQRKNTISNATSEKGPETSRPPVSPLSPQAAETSSPALSLEKMTDGAQMCIRHAAALGMEAYGHSIDSVMLLAGCVLHGAGTEGAGFYAPRFLADFLKQTPKGIFSWDSILELPDRYGITSLPSSIPLSVEIPGNLFTDESAHGLRLADHLRQHTCRDTVIHARHLVAALLTESETAGAPPLASLLYLEELGFKVRDLRSQLLQQILQNVHEDNQAAWEDILGEAGRKPLALPVPGYVSDTVGGNDQLGIEGEVNALCAVAMVNDKNFKPPLSIGLFGDWGSGKSFFMGLMRDRITKLAACALDSEKNGETTAYCSHVAQITFNAWHYIDADLWASLVTKIWEDLARFIAETHSNPEAGKRALREQLKQGAERVAEAELMAQEVEEKRRDLESRIAVLEEERGRRAEELVQWQPRAIASFVFDRPEVREPLAAAAEQMGLSAAAATTRDTISTLAGLAGRFRTLVRWAGQGPSPAKRLGLLVLPVLIAASVGLSVYYALNQSGIFQKVLAAISALAALVIQATTWLRPWIEKVRRVFSQLERAREEIDRAAERRREEISKQEKFLRQELDRLRENEATLQNQLAENRERIVKLQEEIRKVEGPRDVGEFVQTQAISQEYQGRLGFIARVRRDFDRLNQLMAGDGYALREPALPRIDRIVLYIDDLDRCPGDRVVKVLEAVHLLLAMPLFVVVVGVDPRWLLRSLEEHYSEFLVRYLRQSRRLEMCEPLKAVLVFSRLKAAYYRQRPIWSWRLSSSSCRWMYARTTASSRPTVVT